MIIFSYGSLVFETSVVLQMLLFQEELVTWVSCVEQQSPLCLQKIHLHPSLILHSVHKSA